MPSLWNSFSLLAAVIVLPLAAAPAALAIGDEPAKPTIDCTKKANKGKPACTRNRDDAADDEIYNAAYWLAKSGSYAQARALLLTAHNPSDPRILNYLGFTTRKLGDVDGALRYYAKALEQKPDYTLARSYLGEAHLQKGDLAAAKAELGEIERRCGTACQEYAELAGHIGRYEAARPQGG
jgi:tetratricopeptide (TPR) repeat protein